MEIKAYVIMCMHACMLCYILMHAGLNKFIKKLDQRNEKNTKTCPHKKVRVAGCGVHCMIPTGLPAWMVSKERGLSLNTCKLYIIYS